MSVGPTERLIRRARDWAGDVEELSSLQWRLLQLEFSELTAQLRGSVWLFAASIAIGTFGAPLAIVAGLVMLAQAMEWPIANVLAAAGVLLVVLATALWFIAKQTWTVSDWFPRSRRQAKQNLRGIFAQRSSGGDLEDRPEQEYYPD
jgi:hypothetical protein